MHKIALDSIAKEQLEMARGAEAARHSETLLGGHDLAMRQTLIAVAQGADMSEHVNPGQATVYVLEGEIEVRAGSDSEQVGAGEFLVIPNESHSVTALADSVFLLTAVPRGHIS